MNVEKISVMLTQVTTRDFVNIYDYFQHYYILKLLIKIKYSIDVTPLVLLHRMVIRVFQIFHYLITPRVF